MPRIRLRTFSIVRELVGVDNVELAVCQDHEDCTVASMLAELAEKLPGLQEAIKALEERGLSIVVLVNGRHASMNDKLGDGDEVALIPPASGG